MHRVSTALQLVHQLGPPTACNPHRSTASPAAPPCSALIAPRVVLTAAQCFFDDSGARDAQLWDRPVVALGQWDQQAERGERRRAAAIATHQRFNPHDIYAGHDIALLLLDAPAGTRPTAGLPEHTGGRQRGRLPASCCPGRVSAAWRHT